MHKYLIYFTLPLALLLIGCNTQSHIPQSLPAEVHTFVIVHGAWGGGWAFREVDDMLTAQGHKVYRPTLTGQGERVHLASKDVGLETHIDDVVNTILYEELNDIILVGHSYGGMVVTGVADRIPERISHLIYLDAMVPYDGESVVDNGTVRDKNRWWLANAKDGFIIPTWVKPDQTPPKDVPHQLKTFTDTIVLKNPERMDIPTDYILTVDPGSQPEKDSFFPHSQRAEEFKWPIHILQADHNPQWSKPKELVDMFNKILK